MKAQLQIMQNMFVLIVIIIILMIALVVGVTMYRSGMQDDIEKTKTLEMVKKTYALSLMPELQCSHNGNLDADCYDLYKINAFKDKASSAYYQSMLGNIGLAISIYDDDLSTSRKIEIYDNPGDQGYHAMHIPVLVRDIEQDRFGVLQLRVYT